MYFTNCSIESQLMKLLKNKVDEYKTQPHIFDIINMFLNLTKGDTSRAC